MLATEDATQDLVRQVLEAAHREYNQGVLENNMAQILAFYEKWTAPDFEERDNPKSHVTDREQMLALMAQAVASGDPGGSMIVLGATTGIAELAVEGSRAVAVTTNKDRYRQTDTHGWYGVSGQEHEVETAGRWRQTWVQTDEGWRLQVNQLLSNETYVDGVLFVSGQNQHG